MAFRFLLAPALVVLFAGLAENSPGQVCPADVVQDASSPVPLSDVCIPEGYTDIPMDYFDDFSWREFVAMVWPAAKGRRGVADTSKTVGDAGPRVFETYKSLWEVFHDDGSAPKAFDQYDPPGMNACNVATGFGDVVLATKSGIDDIGQAGVGELVGPLAAQNGRYVRLQTLYNKIAYDFIVSEKLYLRANLPPVPTPRPELPVVQFPMGSVVLKVSWLDMDGFSDAQKARFYLRPAVVKDADTGKCSTVEMGLVGIHIVVKTPSRPQWIWSSFEQIDAVPPKQFGGTGKFIFSDGDKNNPMPPENPLKLVPLAKEPATPFNVQRSIMMPIHPKTELMTLVYQRLLHRTPWEFYQIATTQWPRLEGNQAAPVPATQGGEMTTTFPGAGATSAFANLTMETFDQGRPQLGCMSCHNQARMAADFMWSVLDHAYPPRIAPAKSAIAH
jgi:hypothetical protein